MGMPQRITQQEKGLDDLAKRQGMDA